MTWTVLCPPSSGAKRNLLNHWPLPHPQSLDPPLSLAPKGELKNLTVTACNARSMGETWLVLRPAIFWSKRAPAFISPSSNLSTTFEIIMVKLWATHHYYTSLINLPCSWGSTCLDILPFITANGIAPKNWNAGTVKCTKKISVDVPCENTNFLKQSLNLNKLILTHELFYTKLDFGI